MTEHRIAYADIDDAIARISKTETVLSVVKDGNGAYLVVTEPKKTRKAPGAKEVR